MHPKLLIKQSESQAPSTYVLHKNFPNSFSFRIHITTLILLPFPLLSLLSILDSLGQKKTETGRKGEEGQRQQLLISFKTLAYCYCVAFLGIL